MIECAKIHNINPEDYLRYTIGHGKASECIKCGKCEKECPQHLPIREHLKLVAKDLSE